MSFLIRCSLLLGLLITKSSFAYVELSPVGYAKYDELGSGLYIGALFAENYDVDSANSFTISGRQRIELKMTIDRLYPRKLIKIFIQGAAINNHSDVLTRNATYMAEFASLFKGQLKKGDHLILAYDGISEVAVFLNDTKLGQIIAPEFFGLMLNTWVGPVPPSTEFRNSILGIIDNPVLAQQYSLLERTESRHTAISGVRAEIETVSTH